MAQVTLESYPMSTALFALSKLFVPLRGTRHWVAAPALAKPTLVCTDLPVREALHPPKHRPLRIVRILEANQTPSQVGRMTISGRMADVCAELDRLAALH